MPGRRILALVALLGCAATACSDADSDLPPDKPATHSSTDSPTTRSAPSDQVVNVPALPRGARKHSLAGAEAFVRHYIDLLNYATATGQTAALHQAARGCASCRNYERLYQRTYANGGYMRYSGWKATEVQAFDQRGQYAVLVTVHAPRIRYRLSGDSEEKIGPSATYKFRFVADRHDGRWVVTNFSQQNLPRSK